VGRAGGVAQVVRVPEALSSNPVLPKKSLCILSEFMQIQICIYVFFPSSPPTLHPKGERLFYSEALNLTFDLLAMFAYWNTCN
jgi:hypothetical protein